MTKITFVGAGSVVFTRELLGDLFGFPALADAHIALHDIDADRLETAHAIARRTADAHGIRPHVSAHLDRRAALEGADYVIVMVQVGMHEATLVDFDLPRRYGLRQTIGDSYGIAAIFRGLRTFPVLDAIAADMAEVASDEAWLLNYTNPMAMNISYTAAATTQHRVVGLCHSVQHTTHHLADLVGVPFEEVEFEGGGINHQSWILRFAHEGVDLYPRLAELVAADPELGRRVRVELYRRFGYFPTESSEHAAEYVPWFLPHDDQIARFRIPIDEYVRRSEANLRSYDAVKATVARGDPFTVRPSVEYAVQIINAMETGEERVIYGNVANQGLIENLPAGACVEVPCRVDRDGVHPLAIGPLPPQCAALNRSTLNSVELAVRAAIDGDPQQLRRAALLDPLASSVLTIDPVWALCDDLVEAHGTRLPAPLRVLLTR